MTEKAFRATRSILKTLPSIYLVICSVILLYYVLAEPDRGWRFVLAAIICTAMAYHGNRIRYNLFERRGRDLGRAKMYISVHFVTVVLIPLVKKALDEIASDSQRQAFDQAAYLEAYSDASTDPRAQLFEQLRILARVAFFALVAAAVIRAGNEYVTFQTIMANAN